MKKSAMQLSSQFSTSGGGERFETHALAFFILYLLTEAPMIILPANGRVTKIKPQGKSDGYDTDDVIAFVENLEGIQNKILISIKSTINFTERDPILAKTIQAAWNDFNNPGVFTRKKDIIMLFTSSLNATNAQTREIFEWAREAEHFDDYIEKINLAKFSNRQRRKSLKILRTQLKNANSRKDVSDSELFEFLRHFYLFEFNFNINLNILMIYSIINAYSAGNAQNIWAQIFYEAQLAKGRIGSIIKECLPQDLQNFFIKPSYQTIPNRFSIALSFSGSSQYLHAFCFAYDVNFLI